MSAPTSKTAASAAASAAVLASHNPSIDEDELPISSKSTSSKKAASAAPPSSSSNPGSGSNVFRVGGASPSTGDRVRSYLLSNNFQCAVQLTVGVVFLSLFVLVDRMRFPMSCQAAVIYAALTLQLFPNVHMGGRIAAATIATGCVFIGALAGGLAVSVAWWSKGAGKNSLIKAVKETMAGPPSPEKAALAKNLAAAMSAKKGAATGASQAEKPKPNLGEAMEFLTQLPIVGSGYYVVLCAVGVASMALFAVVRCDPKNNAVGGLGSILAVVAGLVIANAGAVPVIGLKGFWGAVVVRIIELGLVASAATLVSGALVMPTKATDALSEKLSTTLSGIGSSVTGFGGGLRHAVAAAAEKGALPSKSRSTAGPASESASEETKGTGGKVRDPDFGLVGEALSQSKKKREEEGKSVLRRRRFKRPHGVFYSDKIALARRGTRRDGGPAPDAVAASGADFGIELGGRITDAELLLRLRADSTPPSFDHDGSVIDGLSDDEEAGYGVSSDEEGDGGASESKSRGGLGSNEKRSTTPSASRAIAAAASRSGLLSHSSSRRPDGSSSLPAGHDLREPVTWWRGHLAEANTLLAESRFEPPSMFSGGRPAGGFRPGRWAKVIAKTDALVSRGAALEELCRSPGAANAAVLLRRLHGRDVGVPYREAIGASAAALASLARLLSSASSGESGSPVALWKSRAPGLHGPEVWRGLQRNLSETARSLQVRYWEALGEGGGTGGRSGGRKGGEGGGGGGERATADEGDESMTSHDAVVAMRGYHHATMLCGGLVGAVSDLEGAVVDALGLERGSGGEGGGADAVVGSVKDVEEGGGDKLPPTATAATSIAGKSKERKDPNPWVIWGFTIFAGLSGLMIWMRLFRVAAGLPKVASSALRRCRSGGEAVDGDGGKPESSPLAEARHETIDVDGRGSDGSAQGALSISEIDTDAATPSLDRAAVVYGLKYFAATAGTLVACVLLLWKFPTQLFDWQISTAFVVMAVCLQPRLEDTVPRAALQACLVLLGGTLGYGVMLRADLAGNPGYVGALLAATVFVFGHINALQAVKKPLFLMLSTFMASLLCQYPRAATKEYLGGRVVSTAVGSLLAMVFSAFVFPARASHECLDSVADALEASAEIVAGAWEDFSSAAKRASEARSSPPSGGTRAIRSVPKLRADSYLSDLQRRVDAPLAHVSSLARVDALPSLFDSCVPRGTDLVSPMPPAVKPMAAAASAVARRVAALQLATSRECWGSGGGTGGAEEDDVAGDGARSTPKNPNGALSGVAAASLVEASDAEVRVAIADTLSLIEAVADSLRTRGDDRGMLLYFLPGGARSVEKKRLVIVDRIRATEKSRVAATRAIRASIPRIIAAASSGKLTAEEDLEFEAWAAAFFSCLDALLAAGRAGASRVAQQRSSAASMFGLC